MMLVSAYCFGAGSLGDGDRVPSFEEIERNVGLSLCRGQLFGGNVDDVLLAFQHIELGVNGFFEAFGVLQNNVLGDNYVAGVDHREIRFGGDDKAESLQIGGNANLVLTVSAGQNLAEVYGATLGRDRP